MRNHDLFDTDLEEDELSVEPELPGVPAILDSTTLNAKLTCVRSRGERLAYTAHVHMFENRNSKIKSQKQDHGICAWFAIYCFK